LNNRSKSCLFSQEKYKKLNVYPIQKTLVHICYSNERFNNLSFFLDELKEVLSMNVYSALEIQEAVREVDDLGLSDFMYQDPSCGPLSSRRSGRGSRRSGRGSRRSGRRFSIGDILSGFRF
jgi:hypothetical protein